MCMCDKLLVKKCLKMSFKIGSLLIHLLYIYIYRPNTGSPFKLDYFFYAWILYRSYFVKKLNKNNPLKIARYKDWTENVAAMLYITNTNTCMIFILAYAN